MKRTKQKVIEDKTVMNRGKCFYAEPEADREEFILLPELGGFALMHHFPPMPQLFFGRKERFTRGSARAMRIYNNLMYPIKRLPKELALTYEILMPHILGEYLSSFDGA